MWPFSFCDASFAGDAPHSKSTSGASLALVGPNTFCPITWFVKRQGCVTHSSSEAEIASLDASVRMIGIPCLQFWEIVSEMFSRARPVSSESKCYGSRNVRSNKQALFSSNVMDRFETEYSYFSAVSKSVAPQMKTFELLNCFKNLGKTHMGVESIIDYVSPMLTL